jgi:hypothetical protein
MREISALRKINFSIVEQRQQALERINSLHSETLFSRTQRFPDDELYVCELLGDWARKFQQLKSALSFKERDLRNREGATSKDTNVSDQPQSDAQQAFWNSTTAILDEIHRLDEVYDRLKFEGFFKLNWHDDNVLALERGQAEDLAEHAEQH